MIVLRCREDGLDKFDGLSKSGQKAFSTRHYAISVPHLKRRRFCYMPLTYRKSYT